jgi:two-component system, response regulator
MAADDSEVDVLLVEDNPNDAELTMRALRASIRSERFLHAEDGVRALGMLFEEGGVPARLARLPRMILLDLKLPKLDGLEVLRRVKQDERTRNIPVVVLTSSKEERDILESYRLGANSYLVKPVGFEEYIAAIKDACRYWLVLNQPPVQGRAH